LDKLRDNTLKIGLTWLCVFEQRKRVSLVKSRYDAEGEDLEDGYRALIFSEISLTAPGVVLTMPSHQHHNCSPDPPPPRTRCYTKDKPQRSSSAQEGAHYGRVRRARPQYAKVTIFVFTFVKLALWKVSAGVVAVIDATVGSATGQV
jgi:hypothetical protein